MYCSVDETPAAWPPEGAIFPIEGFEIRVSRAPHPFSTGREGAILDNWRTEIAANPALFNGQMLLQGDVSISKAGIRTTAHPVSFSTFLLWRKSRPDVVGHHLFGLPVIVSSDGAVIAIRMAQHTANPGKVYCAAGSLDENDIVDGVCDLEANMAREVAEETGLDLRQAVADPGLHALHFDRIITIFRSYRFAATAEELLAVIDRHMRTDTEQEIDGAVAIFDSDPARHAYAAFMPPVLAWLFDRGQGREGQG